VDVIYRIIIGRFMPIALRAGYTYRGIRRNILQHNIPTDNVMCTRIMGLIHYSTVVTSPWIVCDGFLITARNA